MYKRSNRGFTLIELVVVVIIVGLLSSIALPRFFETAERMRTDEGRHLLLSLYAAQKRYELEHATGQFATALSDLNIEIRIPDNFENIVVGSDPLVRIDRKGNRYRLQIDTDANITCTNLTGSWCAVIGY